MLTGKDTQPVTFKKNFANGTAKALWYCKYKAIASKQIYTN